MSAAALPRLLLVDDDPIVLRALARVLRSRFEIVTAVDAHQADLQLDRSRFDAVVTDFDLPREGGDGVWVLERARAKQPSARRVLLSGNDIESVPSHLATGLIHAFVWKSSLPDGLLDALATRR